MSVEIGHQEIQSVKVQPGVQTRREVRRLSVRWAIAPLFLSDMLCIALSMVAAYQLRFHVMRYYSTFSPTFYVRLAVFAVLTWWIVFALYRLYHPDYLFVGIREYGNVINACTFGLVALIVYSFLYRGDEYDISRGWLAIVWLLSIVTVGSARFVYRRVIYRLRRQGLLVHRALVVGANEEGQQVAAQLRELPDAGVEIVGFVDVGLPLGSNVNGIPVVGDVGSLASLIERFEVEELIVIPTALTREKLLDIYRDWGRDSDVQIRLSSGLYELFTTGVRVKETGFVPLLSLNRTRITGLDAFVKSVLDYVIALGAVILLSPVLLAIAFLVWRDSGGPIIYRRRVVGLHGRTFDALKFRTMVADADACLETSPELRQEWERTGKIQDDPRITRVGHFLRRYSIDELPQLLNVLRGEMSLVGPRMITPPELRHFGTWRHNLLTVKPGLTGLWQVSGRSDVSYAERVWLDMHYIRNHTVWLDLRLLLSTVSAVLTGRGAY